MRRVTYYTHHGLVQIFWMGIFLHDAIWHEMTGTSVCVQTVLPFLLLIFNRSFEQTKFCPKNFFKSASTRLGKLWKAVSWSAEIGQCLIISALYLPEYHICLQYIVRYQYTPFHDTHCSMSWPDFIAEIVLFRNIVTYTRLHLNVWFCSLIDGVRCRIFPFNLLKWAIFLAVNLELV